MTFARKAAATLLAAAALTGIGAGVASAATPTAHATVHASDAPAAGEYLLYLNNTTHPLLLISYGDESDFNNPIQPGYAMKPGISPEGFYPQKQADGSIDESATFWELGTDGSKIGALTVYFEQDAGGVEQTHVTNNTTDLKVASTDIYANNIRETYLSGPAK